ncbi:TetR/AcrR family transcriptional regulator [Motiliproteus sediminis]|uniref:TetR/AcrR family transcriptional regulator n=1 Tax=Motiliproteus sediminis TaxID=1468178 RepID=UPI001AEF75B6|nr:TetR/AcrR family transcriptional regulator [Motiliproteus sediminis]
MGRPAAFDRDQVVHQVTDLFWKKGYLGTSISDVVAATSLKPGSIYNSFDSKQKLLLEALDHYSSQSFERVQRCLQSSDGLMPALEQMVSQLIDLAQGDPDARGCLMLNIWLEMAAHDEVITQYVQGVFERLEQELRAALERAKTAGELRPEADPEMLAKYIMMTTWGIRVMSRARPDRATLESLADQALMPVRALLA